MELLTLGNQGLIESRIVVADNLTENGQIGTLGLQDHQATLTFAPCTATDLGHHHKGMFVGPEIRIVQHRIGIEDAHDADLIEV